MELTIDEAREQLCIIYRDFNNILTGSQKSAIALADLALRTIEDMKGETEHDS